jgi:thiol:disulfide interchange protein DsbD
MIFAASLLGAFEIVLPSWMVNKTDAQADKGGYIGAFFMAFTLVLVSFSCTAPIVGTILVEAARGSVLRPIIGMFGFSLAVRICSLKQCFALLESASPRFICEK